MIEKMEFGRTGHLSTRTLFGAAALASVTQAEADKTLEVLQAFGINHIDTAASYGDAELRIGPWMKQHRQDFFLATKTEKRSYQGAKEELHRSLERLRVDSVDLWQMHILVDPDEWETAMGPGGALEAFIEAREQGLVRFLGVTGHGTTIAQMHLRSLERFDFDSVLLPYNYAMMQNEQYAADFAALLAVCQERKVAVQTIKAITRGPWGDKPPTRATWYEPLEKQEEIDTAVHYVLNNPSFFLNTVGDIHLLPKVLDAASRFRPQELTAVEKEAARLDTEPLFV
ncbi:MAG: aldo/keto reductase [Ardenticatenaceae bacterium]|nr:aldo/keto reductase [Ardenticatenaceae bacterium]MCB9444992.1 aldo/keto reductase [Ardenticatenaceae bacterium]